MNSKLFDRLECEAMKTEWHSWMSETVRALRHTDLHRSGTWTELERFSKNIPAMRWLISRLDSFRAAQSSSVSTVEPALYILACYCPDNRVLGYVIDTFIRCYRLCDSRGMLMCAQIHLVVNRKEEYTHLNVLYNLMMSIIQKEFRRFLSPAWKGGSFMTENDFREAEQYLPDFKASGFREMVLARATTPMTGEELAKQCHMSNTAFRERFKDTFGMTVSCWLREQKKSKILDMLLHTDLPISKVSERNGFRNETTFSEYCRRNFHSSPSEIRKKHASDKKLK